MTLQRKIQAAEVSDFLKLVDQLQTVLENCGKTVYRSEPGEAARLIGLLNHAQLEGMRQRIAAEIAIHAQLVVAHESLNDPKRQVWRFLQMSGLRPCADLIDKITGDCVVQIFSKDQMLLFATTKFYEVISFTLEQLFSLTWYECTMRDPLVEQKVAQAMMHSISGEMRHTTCPQIPPHEIQELNSARKIRSILNVLWLSPIFKDQEVVAAAAIVGGEILGESHA